MLDWSIDNFSELGRGVLFRVEITYGQFWGFVFLLFCLGVLLYLKKPKKD
jgi:hypothetical protein